jgi:hypothetical protein
MSGAFWPGPEDDLDDQPSVTARISLPFMQCRIYEEGGDLHLAAGDGETEVDFGPGLGNLNSQINGAERLADMATRYVELLRVRRGDRRPLRDEPAPQLAVVDAPAINLGQPLR